MSRYVCSECSVYVYIYIYTLCICVLYTFKCDWAGLQDPLILQIVIFEDSESHGLGTTGGSTPSNLAFNMMITFPTWHKFCFYNIFMAARLRHYHFWMFLQFSEIEGFLPQTILSGTILTITILLPTCFSNVENPMTNHSHSITFVFSQPSQLVVVHLSSGERVWSGSERWVYPFPIDIPDIKWGAVRSYESSFPSIFIWQ